MTHQYILSLSDAQATLETVGGKGASLARLAKAGLPVPAGFHVTTLAYKQFVAENDLQPRILAALEGVDAAQPATLETASRVIEGMFAQAHMPQAVALAVAQAYADLGDRLAVAVRSSATAEDLPGLSFAGQQETFLNIRGAAEVQDAVKRCWASLWTARAIGYRAQHAIDQEAVSLAVVVQQLVSADAAGILFTADPVSGQRQLAMITASWGLGEAIVGGAVTPDTLTVDKASGEVQARETTDKQVMTVRLNGGGTQEMPTPEPLRRASVLSDPQAAELTRLGVQIEQLYGMPMDIEWTLTLPSPPGRGDGGEGGVGGDGTFAIVQARPITALPPCPATPDRGEWGHGAVRPPTEGETPQSPISVEWKLPNPKGQYMRGSIVDLMPDPVSPLFATLGLTTVSRVGVKQIMRPLTRSEPDLPDDYILTINEYAYMGVAFTPHQVWWILTKMIVAFPRIIREALPLWRDEIRPAYVAAIARWQDRALDTLSVAELWGGVQEVNEAAMVHLSSLLVATTGASAGSEILFTNVYDRLIRRKGDPPAVTFLMGYNSTPIQAEKSLYDLAMWCRELPSLAAYLLKTPVGQAAAQLVNGAQPEPVEGWQAFCERFQAHQQAYGHIVYDLDFAKPLPLDTPAPMLETIKMYLEGLGTNPHERQRAAEEKRTQAVEATLERLRGLRRWAFRKALSMAQTMAQVRENALSDIGLGYPLLQQMLRELGRRFVPAGAIAQEADIFWLEADEVHQAVTALEGGEPPASLAERVAQRKARHEVLKRATPPPMLPPKKKYMGIDMEAFTPATAESQAAALLKGVAASAGQVTAPARVLRGPEDFSSMRPGEVLVAGTTTPAWTPLFAMASAVVTDIGGPLSHGSIVAREYGIPAVMGTGVATRRIQSGQLVTVDGSAGTVALHAGS
jgi:phosphohistidine swiveling domain-containing protein